MSSDFSLVREINLKSNWHVQNQSVSISTTMLPRGLDSYRATLQEMAKFVRQATTDYGLKRFCSDNLLRFVKGHDFNGEVTALFFSLGIGSLTAAIR